MLFNLHTMSIVFSNGNQAQAVLLPSAAEVQQVPPLLDLPPFSSVIMLMGGAGFMDKADDARLAALFTQGVALFAATHNALVIDGGTQFGVMELMGLGIAAQSHKSPLLGVAPARLVSYPGQSDNVQQKERVLLDSNHSHFVLVDTDEWGGETATMYELAQLFSQHCPSLALLVNGGAIALQEVLYNVRQRRPIIVLQGSGRAADTIARLWQEQPTTISDPHLAEIIQHGYIYLFPISGSAMALMQLMQEI